MPKKLKMPRVRAWREELSGDVWVWDGFELWRKAGLGDVWCASAAGGCNGPSCKANRVPLVEAHHLNENRLKATKGRKRENKEA